VITRARRPRFWRQLALAVIAAVVALVFFLMLPDPDPKWRLSMGTAYGGLLFLAATLMIGPLNVLRGVTNPVSSYLRRDVGIVAGVFALIHTIIGLQVHLRGDFIQYFFYRTPKGIFSFRHDLFGLANYLGLAVTLIVLVLLAISNNLSIRTLGASRWKAIQRWNYMGAILTLTHGLLYQAIEKRLVTFVAGSLIVAAAVMVVQLFGFWRTKQELNQR
jgi:methionine sulfoxide reductase heme-binding subunit